MEKSTQLQPPHIMFNTPVVSQDKFASYSGLPIGVVNGLVKKQHLPSVKIGRYRLINLVRLSSELYSDTLELKQLNKHQLKELSQNLDLSMGASLHQGASHV